jgi:hypothetical protein
VLVGLVGAALNLQIRVEPLGRHQQPLGPRPGDRIRVVPAVLLELAPTLPQPGIPPLPPAPHDLVGVEPKRHLIDHLRLGLGDRPSALPLAPQLLAGPAEELAPALRGAQLLGQLITTRLAELFVLGLVGRPDLRNDLARDLLELIVDLRAGVPRDPGAVDRHHPRPHQPRPGAELQHLAKQPGQRPLVAADEPRDRRVIGNQVAGDHTIGHVLATVTPARPRRTHPGREGIQDQRHHQRRLIRRPAVTIGPVSRIERRQVHPRHGVDHKPRQVVGRQPLPHIRRQQKPLLTATFYEFCAMPECS